jgi:IPT/TIG domain
MSTGCGEGQFIEDADADDRINLIQKGKYYGHPNPLRAAVDNDARQCVWQRPTDPTSDSHEGPLSTLFPSADGIIEYEADHFDKQLRHNLIVSRYKNGLYRAILSPDGRSILPDSAPPIPLVGAAGLDVTQAPNGNLIEVRLSSNSLGVHIAQEAASSSLQVKAVFPRRGGQAGGNKLTIYGNNLGTSASTMVTVGRSNCPITASTTIAIECILPGGPTGSVNVTVSGLAGSYTFERGYRYIPGFRS